MRLVRVVNDTGLAIGTKVFDVESGAELPGVASIEIQRFGSGDPIRVEIGFFSALDVKAAMTPMFSGRAIKSLTLADGEVIEF